MHDPEDLVNIVLGELIRLLCTQKNFVQLIDKCGGLKEIHIHHAFHSGFNLCHFSDLSFHYFSLKHSFCETEKFRLGRKRFKEKFAGNKFTLFY